MGNKKVCSCGYWNEAQQECLYAGSACIRDEEKRLKVTDERVGEKAEELDSLIDHRFIMALDLDGRLEILKEFIYSFIKEIQGK